MSGAAERAAHIDRLREQAALERRVLAAQLKVVGQQTHSVSAVAGSVLGFARSLLGVGAGAGPLAGLGLLGRLGLAPIALRLGIAAVRSRAGRWALVAGAVGGAVWWWRGARRAPPKLPPSSGI